jgi:hypothetical protein
MVLSDIHTRDQPAFIDEDGQFVQAEMLRMTIQCRAGTH